MEVVSLVKPDALKLPESKGSKESTPQHQRRKPSPARQPLLEVHFSDNVSELDLGEDQPPVELEHPKTTSPEMKTYPEGILKPDSPVDTGKPGVQFQTPDFAEEEEDKEVIQKMPGAFSADVISKAETVSPLER